MDSDPPAPAREVALPEGGAVLLRPISPMDRELLSGTFAHLSATSRYRRFLGPRDRLTPKDLNYLTGVDHHDHEALMALDPATGEGVGVARYIREPDDPATAELAVAVVDDWQGRGVGVALVSALVERAHAEGVRSFRALVLAENARMLHLLDEVGHPHVVDRGSGCVELLLDLP